MLSALVVLLVLPFFSLVLGQDTFRFNVDTSRIVLNQEFSIQWTGEWPGTDTVYTVYAVPPGGTSSPMAPLGAVELIQGGLTSGTMTQCRIGQAGTFELIVQAGSGNPVLQRTAAFVVRAAQSSDSSPSSSTPTRTGPGTQPTTSPSPSAPTPPTTSNRDTTTTTPGNTGTTRSDPSPTESSSGNTSRSSGPTANPIASGNGINTSTETTSTSGASSPESPASTQSAGTGPPIGAIVGGVVGGVVLIIIIVAIILLRKRKARQNAQSENSTPAEAHILVPRRYSAKYEAAEFLPTSNAPSSSLLPLQPNRLDSFPNEKQPLEPTPDRTSTLPPPSFISRISAFGSPSAPPPPSFVSRSNTVTTTLTARQRQLRQREEAAATQIETLENMPVDQLEEEHPQDLAAEIARLRQELQWSRDQQTSSWALGLSDQPPPTYAA